MQFTQQTSADGVVEREFTLDQITGVLWSPAAGSGPGPLILMGHGGGLHKKAPGLVARARHYVTDHGFSVASIDAPGHGDRPRSAEDQAWVAAMLQARADGRPIDPYVIDYNASLAERAVPEWRTTLDELQALPELGADVPVGYGGMTLASAIGLPLLVAEPRISAAVIGGVLVYDALLEAARRITVPIQFLLPWDDAELSRGSGLALFDAFASSEKTLHATTGSHFAVPWFEAEDSARFYARHLGRTETAAARGDRPGAWSRGILTG